MRSTNRLLVSLVVVSILGLLTIVQFALTRQSQKSAALAVATKQVAQRDEASSVIAAKQALIQGEESAVPAADQVELVKVFDGGSAYSITFNQARFQGIAIAENQFMVDVPKDLAKMPIVQTGRYLSIPGTTPTKADISADQALDTLIGKELVRYDINKHPQTYTVVRADVKDDPQKVFIRYEGVPHLAWFIKLTNWRVYIDAYSGENLASYDEIQN